jgi:replicative DNA helicase
MASHDRTPELTAERAVLGGILVDPLRYDDAADILGEADFFRDAHRLIWQTIRDLVSAGKAVDLLTVKAGLGARLEDAGGPVYLAELIDGVPRSSNVSHYAQLVRDYAVRRAVEAAAQRLIALVQVGDATGAELLEQGEAALLALRTAQPSTGVVDPSARVSGLIAAMEDMARGGHRGVATGLRDLDRLMPGWRPGQLIVLGARPGMGKTALGLTIAHHIAQAGPVLFASLEMSAEQIATRELSLRSGVPHYTIDHGPIPPHVAARVAVGLEAVQAGGIHVLDRAGATVSQIRAAARRLMAETRGPLALVVVDYLQLMRSDRGTRPENRTQEVSHFSQGLKLLARELGVPVLALSQLSRQAETRADKRPFLADLRESGALEQDADIVLLLHRPGYYDRDVQDDGAEIIVAKNRHGGTGTARARFAAAYMRFEDAPPMAQGGDDGR